MAESRRALSANVKNAMRELNNQISLLNHQVGSRVALKDVDLDCLDLLSREGSLSPSALAKRAGLHPATVTGILDRLEKAGWVAREADPRDRRALLVTALRSRAGEIIGHYSGMNSSLDRVCAEYSVDELKVIADFLRRSADAGRAATDELAAR